MTCERHKQGNTPSAPRSGAARLSPRRECTAEALEGRRLFATYSIIDLGTLGGTTSKAFDINEANQVVGSASNAGGVTRAFRFSDVNVNGVADASEMVALNPVSGDVSSVAYSINANGAVAGSSQPNANDDRAVRWDAGSTAATSLGLGVGSTGYGINAAGDIVGAYVSGGSYVPFLLPAAGGGEQTILPSGYSTGEARGINDTQGVAGWVSGSGDAAFARLAGSPATGFRFPDASQPYAYAWDINNANTIVGEGFNSSGDYRAFSSSNGTVNDLGTLDGYDASEAYGVNNLGQVVGRIEVSQTGATHAFLDTGGAMQDLNGLIPANSGWVLQEARAINDAGAIVGWGVTPGGLTHAFMLVSAPAPTLLSTQVGDGTAQRSIVKTFTLVFDQAVTMGAGAVTVAQLQTDASGNVISTTDVTSAVTLSNPSSDGKMWLLQPMAVGTLNEFGSFKDGIYRVTVHAGAITGAGGGSTLSGGDQNFVFHRLFGDADGNKAVNNADFGLFRNSFGKSSGDAGFNPAFDFDNNGVVNNADYGQFRNRFLKMFTYV